MSRLRLALAFAILTAAPAATFAAGVYSLPVSEAIARALEHNEDILVARESLAAAEAATLGARGAYDPFLEVEAGWRETTSPVNSAFSGAPAGRLAPTEEGLDAGGALTRLLPTGGLVSLFGGVGRTTTDSAFAFLSPAYDTELGVELRQPLLRNRAVDSARVGLRVAAADRSRSAAGLEAVVAETVVAVERAYWTLVAARHAVEVQAEAVRLAEEQLDETEIRIQEGAAPETEIAQPRAEVERRRGELYATQEERWQAENALKLLILGDEEDDPWARELVPEAGQALEPRGLDLDAALERALAVRPEVGAAQALVERRQAEATFARDRVRPTLDAVASYGRFGLAGTVGASAELPEIPGEIPSGLAGDLGDSLDVLRDGELEDARIGLVFSLPLGNRAARAAASQAGNVVRQAEAELRRARKLVRAQVLDAAAAVETAAQRIEATRAALSAAEVQLAAERERYAAGLSTNFLVLTRQNDLSRARLQEIAALADYRTARAELERATGSLLERHGIEVLAAKR